MTIPTDLARLALDNAGAVLDTTRDAITQNVTQLRTALADAYGRTGTALTEAAHSIDAAEKCRKEADERAKAAEAKLAAATRQIGLLTAVDEGRAHGARRIMNERDQAQARAEKAEQRVAELETDRDAIHEALSLAPGQLHDVAVSAILGRGHTIGELIQRAKAAEADAERFKADHLAACKTIADMHEAATGRTGMGPIRGVVEDVADMRARAENFEGRAKAMDQRARHWRTAAEQADATLQRVRDAETLADALTAVGEHDGLPPEAARAAANIAAAAEQPAVVDAERERDHALRLAAAEQARAEAVRVADRAHQTMLRVKHAPTATDAWTAIGAHYHLPAAEAGQYARRWRSTAEDIAAQHAQRAEADVKQLAEQLRAAEERGDGWREKALDYDARADRFEAAWQNARRRAQFATHREEMVRARAKRYRESRNRWTRQALDAEDTIKRVRALLGTHLGPLATNAVRNALATPEG